MSYDYLVVGQGLAGSAIAVHLMKRSRNFMVIDLPEENTSSSVAAGIFNPITGQKWVKTWLADTLFPYTHRYYKEVENITKEKFLFKKKIFRPFSDLSEQNDWMGRSESPVYSNFIEKVERDPFRPEIIENHNGGLLIKSGGNLRITNYLNAVRKLLIQNGTFLEELFDWQKVNVIDGWYEYKEKKFEKIIFCLGPQSNRLELWDFLPFRLVKGEVLTVDVRMDQDIIYNKGAFIMPLDAKTSRIGATYDYQNLESGPSEKGRRQLVERVKGFFKLDYSIKDQRAGIRPATIDRKPFLGTHPNDKKLVIFNGLGAKGVTLAPFFADHLLDHIENDGYLMKEVDINRFY